MEPYIFTDLETYEEFIYTTNFGIITLKDYNKMKLHLILYNYYLNIEINEDIMINIWKYIK